MYSLCEITRVCAKIERVSDDGEFNEDDHLSDHSDAQTDRMSDEFPLDNINTLHVKRREYNSVEESDNTSTEETTTNAMPSPSDGVSISQLGDNSLDPKAVYSRSAGHASVSLGTSTEGENTMMNGHATAPSVQENGSHEALFVPMWTAGDDQKIYDSNIESRTIPEQNAVPERLRGYQSPIYGRTPYVPVVSKREFSPYQGFDVYIGTHRSLTPYEMDIPRRPCCNCPCHIPSSSYALGPEVKNQRPSVIMVPAKRIDTFSDVSASKMESVTHRLLAENARLARDLQQSGFSEMADSDSSDDGEDGKQEKYFRVNIDGTFARFKLTKEDWERIPINTFPSGGRLLSGDWTRIFLSKVKESNPWCSLRFKNNHVRSENSRKIHSAVFFRGGAECKRPECNVKVRFVIRKEKGKHVDVTYVGNVCHSRNPGGNGATNSKKRRQVRFSRTPSNAQD